MKFLPHCKLLVTKLILRNAKAIYCYCEQTYLLAALSC